MTASRGAPDRLPFLLTAIAFALFALWDASGLDLALARLAGGASGFPLREDRLLVLGLHEVPRFLSMAGVAVLLVAVRWPFGVLRRLDARARLRLALSVLAALAVVSLLKNTSRTSCPWDLAEFGGVATYVSHWARGLRDGGPGRCFPAGHASAAFAYLAGWFALRRVAPRAARVWLVTAAVCGLVLGLAQQWRGAHYMSHTLWTAWVCWSVALAIDAVARARAARASVKESADRAAGAAVSKLNES
ncbi:phosphatase PAP2 family protein [Comamonadaceae bacterium OTU4NAUVB1]|nr:phosphatase PAP2 family protein [Comamonadaceae bacterium OTU4NAUVB1]